MKPILIFIAVYIQNIDFYFVSAKFKSLQLERRNHIGRIEKMRHRKLGLSKYDYRSKISNFWDFQYFVPLYIGSDL